MKRYIKSSEDWRLQNPNYQEKTLGGIYFYSRPGAFGERIERSYYDRLPKYDQKLSFSYSVTVYQFQVGLKLPMAWCI